MQTYIKMQKMNTHLKLSNNLGSSEIWSDKLKDLYIRHTESRSGRR